MNSKIYTYKKCVYYIYEKFIKNIIINNEHKNK